MIFINLSGSVILLIGLALFSVIGLQAIDGATAEANLTSGTSLAVSGVSTIVSPLILVFGMCVLLLGAYAVINSFAKM